MEGDISSGGAATATMHVLVAIDGSDEGFYALRWALDKILKQTDQNSTVVTIAYVVEPLPLYAFPGGYVVDTASKAQEEYAARVLSRAFEMCRDCAVKAKTVIVEGDPKDKICRLVEELNINLLVIGSRGLGQIKRAFLGSVSDYCSHHAKCPVLVVKPQPPSKT